MADQVQEDDILLAIVREQGCNIPVTVKSIGEFDAPLFFHTASVCLTVYHNARQDGTVPYPTKLPGGKAQQFRIGTSMAEDMKQMGYTQEVGYESFLYPAAASMKKILRFLVDKLPKPESEGAAQADGAPVAGGLLDVKKVLKEWTQAKWKKGATTERTRFPIRSVNLTVPSTSVANQETLTYYAQAQPLVTQQTRSFASFVPSILTEHSLELIRKEDLVDEFDRKAKNAECLQRIKGLLKGAYATAIREHEQHLATRGTAKDASFSRTAGGVGGRSAFGRRNYFENDQADTGVTISTGDAAALAAAAAQSKEEREAAEKAARDAQLAALQAELDEILASQRTLDQHTELLASQTRQLEEELARHVQTSRDLEDAYVVKKRTLDLLPDAQNNLIELQKLVAASRQRLVDLATEWEAHRVPLLGKLRRAKQLFHERKADIAAKIDTIRRLREEMKEKANDLREKEKLSKVLLEELNSLPKSINRQVYVKRIMDLMKQIDKQNAQIKAVLADVRQVQKDINTTSESSKRSFAVADEIIYQAAKKNPRDETMTKTYKYVVNLREGFVDLVASVEAKGKIENEIMSLRTQMDDIAARNTNLNMERIEADLVQVRKENKELAAQIKAASK